MPIDEALASLQMGLVQDDDRVQHTYYSIEEVSPFDNLVFSVLNHLVKEVSQNFREHQYFPKYLKPLNVCMYGRF